jgi:hypothetical protein
MYEFYGQRFWAAAMLQGLVIQVTYVLASYLGSRQMPNLREPLVSFSSASWSQAGVSHK